MSGYLYLRTEPRLWTVGHYTPDGEWIPESDHGSSTAAAERVSVLNGGVSAVDVAELIKERDDLKDQCKELLDQVQCLQWDLGALQQQHDLCPQLPVTGRA
ncbi:hypothetical protein [Nocardia seriolae]|uniref:Uncharacterized protein n=1 Tax=Nocardia seriolae TaxID=37332 RepID=A0A0B8N667_9NOCA|nr:hypothetical protein [Nocardia seriolae]APB01698.1 hypothetical protein NS506_07679 [Nocardia seriolae]MTJ60834.1 hypothetical protein [Nocardia seriolae]MTJ76127.1 hypothetical protein [Nocardia seriolae]MTJ91024.1 hypothetical protein [Nocardia seriolae]MTK34986.1 hypothetical protein [Nocardia seriolae]